MAKSENKMMLLSIFKDTNYNISVFTDDEIKALEKKIFLKNNRPYVECLIREKDH